jgi:hypothetical protein
MKRCASRRLRWLFHVPHLDEVWSFEMGEKSTIVELEILLKSGREVWLTLELPRDSISESETTIVYTRRPEPDGGSPVTEEYTIERAELAYKRELRREVDAGTFRMRTLGVVALAPSS